MAKKLEIENRTRSTFVFSAFREVKGARGKPRLVHDHENDVVIGDRELTPEKMEAKGAVYSRKVPPPSVEVPEEWLAGLHPSQRAYFDGLVAADQIRVREFTV